VTKIRGNAAKSWHLRVRTLHAIENFRKQQPFGQKTAWSNNDLSTFSLSIPTVGAGWSDRVCVPVFGWQIVR
jgi:hypothetical protein